MEGIARIVASLALASLAAAQGGWRQPSAPWHPSVNTNTHHAMTYDTLRSECVLVRSYPGSSWVDAWNGSNWQGLSNGANTPSMHRVMTIAHDPVRDRLLVVSEQNQMWEWDRSNWYPLGITPFTGLEFDLCWDPTRQKIVTVFWNGIWEWNGTSWQLAPGTTPPTAAGIDELQLAFDTTRGVLIVTGDVGPSDRTLEWDGANWTEGFGSFVNRMDIVYAPALGGTVGYRRNDQDTFLWDLAAGNWRRLTIARSPGFQSDFSMAYDVARGRLVVFAPTSTPTWEHDPNHTPPPQTFVVDHAGGGDFTNMRDAIRAVSFGDRLIVRAGNYVSSDSIERGIQIDCEPGTSLGWLSCTSLIGDRPLVVSNAQLGGLFVEAGGALRLRNCSLTHGAELHADPLLSVGFEQCTIGTWDWNEYGDDPWPAVSLYPGTYATIDSCTITGGDGLYDPFGPVHHTPSDAVLGWGNASVVVIDSVLTGGEGFHQTSGAPTASAINVQGGSAVVLGASTLNAGASTHPSSTAVATVGTIFRTPDGTYNGTMAGAQTMPNQSWLDAPIDAAPGQTFDVTATMQPGDLTLLAFALDAGAPLPLFGSRIPLLLDAAGTQTLSVLTAAAPAVSITIPNDPTLEGQPLYWQGLTLSATDGWQLTNRRSTFVQ